MTPVQVAIIPVAPAFFDYARRLKQMLHDDMFRVRVDDSDDSVGKKAVDDQLKAHDLTRADLSDLAHRILLFGAVQTEVTADALRQQYEDDIANYTTVQVDHILVKTKAEADEVYAQVTAPGATEQDFLDLGRGRDAVREADSNDRGSAYLPEFAAAAIRREPGDLSP
jgi:hypothetical protein